MTKGTKIDFYRKCEPKYYDKAETQRVGKITGTGAPEDRGYFERWWDKACECKTRAIGDVADYPREFVEDDVDKSELDNREKWQAEQAKKIEEEGDKGKYKPVDSKGKQPIK